MVQGERTTDRQKRTESEGQTPLALSPTPGPWRVNDDKLNTLTIVRPWDSTFRAGGPDADGWGDYRGVLIAEVTHQNDNPCVSKARAEANARLMAAAPELFTALSELLAFTEIDRKHPFDIYAYRAVYSRAKHALDQAKGL